MKKIILFVFFVFSLCSLFSQNVLPIHGEHFVVGLTKATYTELEFIKGDLAEINKIVSADFVYKDKILMIETNTKDLPYLTYEEIEGILTKYFNKNDIYVKEYVSFEELKEQYSKSDKINLK